MGAWYCTGWHRVASSPCFSGFFGNLQGGRLGRIVAGRRTGLPRFACCALRMRCAPLAIIFQDGQIVGSGRSYPFGLIAHHHIPHLGHSIGLLAWEEVPVGVHCQRNGRMPHHCLYRLNGNASHRQPRPAGMPQAMEVDELAIVVCGVQEVALLTP